MFGKLVEFGRRRTVVVVVVVVALVALVVLVAHGAKARRQRTPAGENEGRKEGSRNFRR